jgi:flagellar biosynthetic protein FlhB
MAEENENGGSKTEAPSQRKLTEAREQGNIPKSQDVASFFTLAGASGVVLVLGGVAARQTADRLLPFLQHPDAFDLSGAGGLTVAQEAARAAEPALWVLAAAATAAVAGNLVQQGFIWAPSRLVPDPSRLSVQKGLERLFGLDGIVNFFKSLLKVVTLAALVWGVTAPRTSILPNLVALDIAAVLPLSAEMFRSLVIAVLILLAVVALADFLWQRQRFTERLKMTKEEVKEDNRQSEGDPHVKAKLRQLRMRRARSRVIQSVPKATVVVTNPTHYAVALRYVQGETTAPVCVAKGLDSLALKIRAVAEANKIPVVEDPPLARALYAAMEIDEMIPKAHYQAVAKLIGFVMGQQGKRRPVTPKPSRL